MTYQTITDQEKTSYDKTVSHPLQAFEWGEFRKKTGIGVVREAIVNNKNLSSGFQLTIHKIPHLPWNIGYLPKGNLPDETLIEELKRVGKENRCIFIQLEPDVIDIENLKLKIENLGLRPSAHPLFTKYTFTLALTKSEDELLKNMHPKTRYNIKVAKKHGVKVSEDNSDKAFEQYLRLTEETTKRQGFYAHSKRYHELMWETLKAESGKGKAKSDNNELSAHLLIAQYKPSPLTLHPISLVAWIVFVFKDTLYYPYGASSNEHRETMASTLMMWEAIKFGKRLGLTNFDMWGALSQNPDPSDPWAGFHRFKQGFGAQHTEFVGSYDLVLNRGLYFLYVISDKIRWAFLKLKH